MPECWPLDYARWRHRQERIAYRMLTRLKMNKRAKAKKIISSKRLTLVEKKAALVALLTGLRVVKDAPGGK